MLISVKNVSIKTKNRTILENININIKRNQHWLIMGTNGSGKTILGELLANKIKHYTGEAKYCKNIAYISLERVENIIANEIENDETDITDIVDYGTTLCNYLKKNHPNNKKIDPLLQKFKLTEEKNTGIRFLSTGELRKVMLIELILQKPQIAIFDNPFDGLDLDSQNLTTNTIKHLEKQGTTIILISGRSNKDFEFIKNAIFVNNNKILFQGKIDSFYKNNAIKNIIHFEYSIPKEIPKTIDSFSFKYPKKTIIDIKNLKISYDNRPIINNLTWKVEKGEHWKIIGPNGCGKTTLLRIINADHPQSYNNDITLFGHKRGTGESIWDIKKYIGLVSVEFQRDYRITGSALSVVVSGLFDTIGLYRNVETEHINIAKEWIKILNLEDKTNTSFNTLSYGEQRMVIIARAMIKQPQILILDEPCQGLDDTNSEMILKLIDYICKISETQILYVNHNADDIINSITKELHFVKNGNDGYKFKIVRKK